MLYLTEEEESRRWRVLSVLAMLSVVLIHANGGADSYSMSKWNVFVHSFFADKLTAWAVPFFFVQSGYWAARVYCQESRSYFSLLKSKSRTLLVPYLIWAIYGGLCVLPLVCYNNYIRGGGGLFDRTFLEPSTVLGCLGKLFGITCYGPIGASPLWYVRMLLLIFLTLPIWILVARLSRWLVLFLGLLVLSILPSLYIEVTPYQFRLASFGYFFIGMALALFNWQGIKIPKNVFCATAGIWMVWAIALSLEAAGVISSLSCLSYVQYVFCLSGIIVFCGLYDCCHGIKWHVPCELYQTFWIYCVHYLITSYIKRGLVYCLGKTDFIILLSTLISFFVALVFSAYSGVFIRKISPKFYSVLTGGR